MLFVVCCVALIYSLLIEGPFLAIEKSLFSLFDKKQNNNNNNNKKQSSTNKLKMKQITKI